MVNIPEFLLDNKASIVLGFIIVILFLRSLLKDGKIKRLQVRAFENSPQKNRSKSSSPYDFEKFTRDFEGICCLLNIDPDKNYADKNYIERKLGNFFHNASEKFVSIFLDASFDELSKFLEKFDEIPEPGKDGLRRHHLFVRTEDHVNKVAEEEFQKIKNDKGNIYKFSNTIKTKFNVYGDLYPSFYQKIEKAYQGIG